VNATGPPRFDAYRRCVSSILVKVHTAPARGKTLLRRLRPGPIVDRGGRKVPSVHDGSQAAVSFAHRKGQVRHEVADDVGFADVVGKHGILCGEAGDDAE
jgi:hypothetical protein